MFVFIKEPLTPVSRLGHDGVISRSRLPNAVLISPSLRSGNSLLLLKNPTPHTAVFDT